MNTCICGGKSRVLLNGQLGKEIRCRRGLWVWDKGTPCFHRLWWQIFWLSWSSERRSRISRMERCPPSLLGVYLFCNVRMIYFSLREMILLWEVVGIEDKLPQVSYFH